MYKYILNYYDLWCIFYNGLNLFHKHMFWLHIGKIHMEMLTTGPMCRYASDLLPLMRVMALEEGSKKLNIDSDSLDIKRFVIKLEIGSLSKAYPNTVFQSLLSKT